MRRDGDRVTGGAGEAERWENAEEVDFYVRAAGPNSDGVTWIWLMCSACGNVQATASGEPSDLGGLSVAAQGHYTRKHRTAIA